MDTSASKILEPGTLLHSEQRDYTVIKVLGQGGFGITYLVEGKIKVDNILVKAKFAVKEFFISSICDRESETQKVIYSQPVAETVDKLKKSFLKEAKRLHQLGIDHPHIVKINEIFEGNNTAYYVMEFLEGNTLQEYVSQAGRITEVATEAIMRPIIEAMAVLHSKHLTHYDIKPQNIILSSGGPEGVRSVLIDFGLAKHYNKEGNATSTASAEGYSVGYAPIEQYAGFDKFSPQADVYSLAATMYFCLTGEVPPPAHKLKTEQVRQKLLSLEVSQRMVNSIVKGLQMLPEGRPENAGDFHKELFQEGKDFSTSEKDKKDKKGKDSVNSKQEYDSKTDTRKKKSRNTSLITVIFWSAGIALLYIGILFISFPYTPSEDSSDPNIGEETEYSVSKEKEEKESIKLVKDGTKFGYKGASGQIIIPCEYDLAGEFSDGLAAVRKGDQNGFIDQTGKWVITGDYDFVDSFKDGTAVVGKNRKYGLIDKTGKVVIPLKYDYVMNFSEGLAPVQTGETWSYVDESNNVVLSLGRYRWAYPFHNGLARVETENLKTGFINKEGKLFIPAIYSDAEDFEEGKSTTVAWKEEGVKGTLTNTGIFTPDSR